MTSFANSFKNSTLVRSCCKAVPWNNQELCLWNWEPNIQASYKFWKLFFMITPQTTVNYQFFHGALHIEMGWLFLYSSLLSLPGQVLWSQESESMGPKQPQRCGWFDFFTADTTQQKISQPYHHFLLVPACFCCLMVSTQSQNICWDISPKGSKWTSNRLLPSDISLKVILKNQQVVLWFLWTLWFQTATFQPLKGDGQYHGTILVPEYIVHQFKHPNLFGQSPGKCLLPKHTPFRKDKFGSGVPKAQEKTSTKGHWN